jgi:hypothetical protein
MSEWQPIETGPKSPSYENQIRLLLFVPERTGGGNVVIGLWRGNDDFDGIWFCSEDDGPISWGECKPTHWMPLPAPPNPAP